jgi:hypothetical protein
MALEAPGESTEGHQRLSATSSPTRTRHFRLHKSAGISGGLLRVTAAQSRWASRVVAE